MSKKNNKKKQKKLLYFGAKLSIKILEKIFLPFLQIKNEKNGQVVEYTNLSSNDLDFLLLLTKYQNNFGVVEGVNYRYFCDELNISTSSFFECLKHLEERKYIKAELMCKGYWKITILDNCFFNADDLKENTYLNTNKDFLYSKEFRKLKVNEKKLCLYLLTQPTINQNINFNIYTGKIKKLLGIKTDYIIRKYLNNIKQFFPNKIRLGKGYEKGADKVTFTTTYVTEDGSTSEKTQYIQFMIDYLITRFKIKCSLEDFKDLLTVINQYTYKITFNKLISIVKYNIIETKIVAPALINTILKSTAKAV